MVKILVVDDDRCMTDRLVRIFVKYGHEAGGAYDGKEGLELLAQVRPDIIFLDYNMPKINGFEFARRVRADPEYHKYSEVPIIGIGHFEIANADDATWRLLNEYLYKPLDLSDIERCIDTYCK